MYKLKKTFLKNGRKGIVIFLNCTNSLQMCNIGIIGMLSFLLFQ